MDRDIYVWSRLREVFHGTHCPWSRRIARENRLRGTMAEACDLIQRRPCQRCLDRDGQPVFIERRPPPYRILTDW